MVNPEFLHDCTQCAALCCMAPHIVKSERFPINKPAATPCHNLMAGGLCKIHAERKDQGYLGCIDFTCLGAGQRVTQQMFGGKSWQDNKDLLEPMARAFLDLYRVQEARWLLQTAAFMGIPPDKEAERVEMLNTYDIGDEDWSREKLDEVLGQLSPDTVRDWLRGLSGGMGMPPMTP